MSILSNKYACISTPPKAQNVSSRATRMKHSHFHLAATTESVLHNIRKKTYHLLFVSKAGEAQRQIEHCGGVKRTAGEKQRLQEIIKTNKTSTLTVASLLNTVINSYLHIGLKNLNIRDSFMFMVHLSKYHRFLELQVGVSHGKHSLPPSLRTGAQQAAP